MKLKYKNCLEAIQEYTGKKPTHSEISKIISISANALSNRLSNDGYLKENEIEKIETYFHIKLLQASDNVEIDYFSDFFNSKESEKISVSKKCFDNFKEDKKYFAIKVYGNGMCPYIEDADKIIIQNQEDEQIFDESIYIFQFKNKYFIKRLIENIDQIIIKSDNPDYPTRFVEKDEIKSIKILGRIVGLVRDVD